MRKSNAAKETTGKSGDSLTEWGKVAIRQLVETVKVLSANEIKVHIKGKNKI